MPKFLSLTFRYQYISFILAAIDDYTLGAPYNPEIRANLINYRETL